MRFVIPAILIGISITVFFLFTNPLYNSNDSISPGIVALKAQVASYDEALNNSKALENQRDILTQKENSIDPDNLVKIQKLLPENIDNIRLILEIEKIASPYGMVLKEIKYKATDSKKDAADGVSVVVQGGETQDDNKDYGVWDLSFSTTSTYTNFLNFIRDLEDNLRIVDITSIQFSSSSAGGATPGSISQDSYKYDFKIRTYWLKN